MTKRRTVHTGLLSTLSQKPIHSPKTIETYDTFATLLDEVCPDVEIETKLQPLKGESFHYKTKLLRMKFDLTTRQKDSGEADSDKPFSI